MCQPAGINPPGQPLPQLPTGSVVVRPHLPSQESGSCVFHSRQRYDGGAAVLHAPAPSCCRARTQDSGPMSLHQSQRVDAGKKQIQSSSTSSTRNRNSNNNKDKSRNNQIVADALALQVCEPLMGLLLQYHLQQRRVGCELEHAVDWKRLLCTAVIQ